MRDELWDVCQKRTTRRGGCMLIHPAQTEQGFAVRTHGALTRIPVEHEGIWLLRRAVGASQGDAEEGSQGDPPS